MGILEVKKVGSVVILPYPGFRRFPPQVGHRTKQSGAIRSETWASKRTMKASKALRSKASANPRAFMLKNARTTQAELYKAATRGIRDPECCGGSCRGFFEIFYGDRDRCKVSLLCANSTMLVFGTTLFVVNLSVLSLDMGDILRTWAFIGMIADGALCITQGIVGLVFLYACNGAKSDEFLSTTALPLSYLVLELSCLIINLLFTLANMALAIKVEITKQFSDETQFVLEINYVLGFSIFLATMLAHSAYHFLLNPWLYTPYVATEVDDIMLEDEKTMKIWGDNINSAYGTGYIGAWDGHAALSLVKSYKEAMTGDAKSRIPYVRGVLLRIDQVEAKRANPDAKMEEDKKLDRMEAGKKCLEPVALVFITVVERFDLAKYVSGPFGKVLSWCFGMHSWNGLLCVRWGLVGFQWPFHGGIFMMRRSREPLEDMAKVQRSLVVWNRLQTKPCTVLMSPCYETQLDSWAFKKAQFLNLEVGPAVIVDLRRYKGMDYKTFQRLALKKGNRRNHASFFQKKGGTYVVSREFKDFDKDFDKLHANLCASTATARVGRGEVPLLCPVTSGVVRSLSETHLKIYRRQFGIRVKGEPAGAAMLFEFPGTKLMTSDMQGLKHDIARPAHAYFAMLALTVELCLKEGIDFLDFGPTTLDPKLDVGGRLIPSRAGYYTHSMILRSYIQNGLERFKALNAEVEERLKAEEKKEGHFWAYGQPYVVEDFQYCTEEIKKKFNVLPKLEPVKDPRAEEKKKSGGGKKSKKKGNQQGDKKSKKQLNKEARKAKRKAAKAAAKAKLKQTGKDKSAQHKKSPKPKPDSKSNRQNQTEEESRAAESAKAGEEIRIEVKTPVGSGESKVDNRTTADSKRDQRGLVAVDSRDSVAGRGSIAGSSSAVGPESSVVHSQLEGQSAAAVLITKTEEKLK
ncbi:hypothetical protein AAMO2058_000070100 [Amorphochlora amoebiformis]